MVFQNEVKSIQAAIYNGVCTIDRKNIYITIHEGIPIKRLTVNSILLNHFKGLIWFDSVCQHQPKLPKTACQNWWLLEKYAVPCVTNRSINCPCKYSRKAMHRKNAKETKINFCHFLYRLETLKKGRNINIFDTKMFISGIFYLVSESKLLGVDKIQLFSFCHIWKIAKMALLNPCKILIANSWCQFLPGFKKAQEIGDWC